MVITSQYSICGNEIYTIFINDVFFAEFDDIEYGEMLAKEINMALFSPTP